MCISYQIHWVCDHIVPLDTEPAKCTPYLATQAKAKPAARVTCPDLTHEEFKSEEVCPGCAAEFVGLAERARGRMMARREGRVVDEMDVRVTDKAREAWSAKQNIQRERVEVFWIMIERGMVDAGVLDEFLQQMGTT